ncbi:hypothetical protein PWT90_05666 [Aphanocladium album]|nr:hypothetical protein PWT90_05666 [Aphanocladium album]
MDNHPGDNPARTPDDADDDVQMSEQYDSDSSMDDSTAYSGSCSYQAAPFNQPAADQLAEDDDADGDDLGNETDDSQEDVIFERECQAHCQPPFENRRQVAFARKLALRDMKTKLADVQADRDDLKEKVDEQEKKIEALGRITVEWEQKFNGSQATVGDLRQVVKDQLRIQLAAEAQFEDDLRRAKKEDKDKRPRKTEITWRRELAKLLLGLPSKSYGKIYNLACNEENSSYRHLFPNLSFVAQSAQDAANEYTRGQSLGMAPATEGPHATGAGAGDALVNERFFRELPINVLGGILRHMVVFTGQRVHVVARLDPHRRPHIHEVVRDSQSLARDGSNIHLLHRFLVGEGSFCLSTAVHPNELLAPLLVSRRWHYVAANLFYSLNRFCFSSIGEATVFFRWIGNNVQRIQSVELFLIGSHEVCNTINERGKFTDRRTHGLRHLHRAIRLKTLGIYLRESDQKYMRRRHEPRGVLIYDKKITLKHKNFRLHRNLHTVQGMDQFMALRGLFYVQLWDYDSWLREQKLQTCVRDSDFVLYLSEQACREKVGEDARQAKFNYLDAIGSYLPNAELKEARCVEEMVTMKREKQPSRPEYYPEQQRPHHNESAGPGGFHGGHQYISDDDGYYSSNDEDDDDSAPRPGPGHHQMRGATAADEHYEEESPDGSADQDWHEGTGDIGSASVDDDVQMGDADNENNSDDDEDSDSEDGDGDDGGVPVVDRRSSSLFVRPGSHEQRVSPGQRASASAVPYSPGFAAAFDSMAAQHETADLEGSLFVADDVVMDDEEKDEEDGGGAPANLPRELQSWELMLTDRDGDDEEEEEEEESAAEAGGADSAESSDEEEKKEKEKEESPDANTFMRHLPEGRAQEATDSESSASDAEDGAEE